MEPIAFDPALYPRAYRPALSRRALELFVGLALLGMAAIQCRLAVPFAVVPAGSSANALLALVWALPGLTMTARSQLRRITLLPDAIEIRQLRTRRVSRADIVSYSVVSAPAAGHLYRLYVKGWQRTVSFDLGAKPDEDFRRWFAGIADADRLEADRRLEAIAGDDRFGATRAQRLERLEQARRTANWTTGLAVAASMWLFFWPVTTAPALLLTAAMPLLALAVCWRFGELITLVDGSRTPGRALSTTSGTLTIALLVPCVMLGMRALSRVTLAEPVRLLPPAVIAVVLFALAARATGAKFPDNPIQTVVAALILGCGAAGSLALADTVFDRAPPERKPQVVIAKRHTTGKGASAYLTLDGRPEFRVPFAVHDRVAVGDHVCLLDHPGALGWPWPEVEEGSACRSP